MTFAAFAGIAESFPEKTVVEARDFRKHIRKNDALLRRYGTIEWSG